MIEQLIPLLTLLTSLAPAGLIFLLPERHLVTRTIVNMAGAVLKLLLIAVMLWGVFHEQQFEFRFPILSGVDFVLRADALAMFFVTLSGLLWLLTTIYAIAFLEAAPHRSRFFGFFSLCVSATIGIALAGNLFTFILFYELLTLSTYPLVVHYETDAARRAGRVYLIYTLTGGALLLLGATWLYALVPSVDFNDGASLAGLGTTSDTALRIIFVLLIAGLGVKAALVPLHGWLPKAMVAPAPVSALLHAVAVVKAGAFGIVRLVYDVYGVDRASALGLLTPLAVWAAVTIVYGSARALFQDDLKRRLAYSTVSQVSYIALGVALLGPSTSVGGIVHLVHQGLMKITLFFCAGNLAETIGVKKISNMHGVAKQMPWTMAAFTAAALGMMGVPPTVGFISKWYLGIGGLEATQYWVVVVLVASSVMNAAYFLPVLYVAWFCEPSEKSIAQSPQGRTDAKWGLLLPPLVTAALSIITGMMAGTPFSPLQWTVLIVERAYHRTVVDRGLTIDSDLFLWSNLLLLAALVVPLMIASMVLCRKLRATAIWLTPLAALPGLILACVATPDTSLDLNWVLLHMHLGLDFTGQVFLLLTSLLWLLAAVYSRDYLAGDVHAARYYFYFLLTMVGNIGLVLSCDMATFYLFFAVMSFATYPLIVHRGDEQAHRAGRVYMVLVIVGEAALMAAIMLAVVARNSLLFDHNATALAANATGACAVGLLLLGFGIKTGIVPLHLWLPLAYPAAPIPATAALSGATINAGLLGWLRFLPMGEASLTNAGELLLILGLVSAFYGVIVGIMQRESKTVLAYSSISQMGLITLGFGGGLLEHQAWPAILSAVQVFILHHGFNKGCLFLSVGVASITAGSSLRQRMLQLGLIVPALMLAGAPFTLGAVSKTGLKYSLNVLPDTWIATLNLLLPLTSIGTTLLMARFLYLVWPPKKTPTATAHNLSNSPAPSAVTPLMVATWLALLILVVTLPWWLPIGLTPHRGAPLLWTTVTWANLWPIGVGTLLAIAAWQWSRHPRSRWSPHVPAGDILALWQVAFKVLTTQGQSLTQRWQLPPWQVRTQSILVLWGQTIHRWLQTGESTLASWPTVAMAMIGVLSIFWWLCFNQPQL